MPSSPGEKITGFNNGPFGNLSPDEIQRIAERGTLISSARLPAAWFSDDAAEAKRKFLEDVQKNLAAGLPSVDQVTAGKILIREGDAGRVIRGSISGVKGAEIPEEIQKRLGFLPQAPSKLAPKRAKPKRKRPQRGARQQEIAGRVLARQRKAVSAFLKKEELEAELKELATVERKLREGTSRSCKHAAVNARFLLEGLADHLFPAQAEPRRGRDKQDHSLGPEDYKNRLIAYMQDHGKLKGEEFRSFAGTMDLVARWAGGGTHGAYKLEDAEHLYTRMIDALSVIARAHAAA